MCTWSKVFKFNKLAVYEVREIIVYSLVVFKKIGSLFKSEKRLCGWVGAFQSRG